MYCHIIVLKIYDKIPNKIRQELIKRWKWEAKRSPDRWMGVKRVAKGRAVYVEKYSVKWPVVGRGKRKEFQGPDLTQLIWRMGLSLHP